MLIYKFPFIYETFFNLPPFLLWKKKGIKILSRELRFFASLRMTNNHNTIKILDVGCGTGFLAPILRDKFPDAEIVGIDTSPQMIDIAREKHGKFAEFKVCDFVEYKEKCDLIVSINTFYFFEMSKIADKVRELVKPGGACIIITYARTPFSVLHQFFTALFLRTFVKTYSPSQFYNAFQSRHGGITVSASLISEIEGTYLLTIRRQMSKIPNA